MKYAIFSDVHSNLEAYDAALEAMANENIDKYYCCGDIVGYGADPSYCISATKDLAPVIVSGNHDRVAAGLSNADDFSKSAREAIIWTADSLDEDAKAYLRALPLCGNEGNDFTLVHGSLNRPEDFEYILEFHSAKNTFLLMQDRNICFVGHTHAAGIFIEDSAGEISYNPWPEQKIEKEKRYIINVGSVGQPRDSDLRAAYCVYDTETKAVRIKRVRYDVERAADKIIKAGLPRILAERLKNGR